MHYTNTNSKEKHQFGNSYQNKAQGKQKDTEQPSPTNNRFQRFCEFVLRQQHQSHQGIKALQHLSLQYRKYQAVDSFGHLLVLTWYNWL